MPALPGSWGFLALLLVAAVVVAAASHLVIVVLGVGYHPTRGTP